MSTIRIRDAEGHVLRAGPLGVVVERCASVPVERVDLWPRDPGERSTVGVGWADESFAVFDLHDAETWVASQPALRDLVNVHTRATPVPRGRV